MDILRNIIKYGSTIAFGTMITLLLSGKGFGISIKGLFGGFAIGCVAGLIVSLCGEKE